MFKTIPIIVMAALCLNFSVSAQFYEPSEKTIRLGEALPESFYQTIHKAINAKTGAETTLQLDKYRDKLIILDFWATWCGPCIHSLIKMDSIKAILNNENIVFIPVTYQRQTEVVATFNKYKWNMSSIIADSTLSKIFPHSGIPHQVWIKNGKVQAIPMWTYLTTENLLKTLKAQQTNMLMNIQDLDVDPSKPMFVSGNGKTGWYYKTNNAIIARYLKDYRVEPLKYLTIADTTILYCVNNNLKTLLYEAFKPKIFPSLDIRSGIIWNLEQSLINKLTKTPQISMYGNPNQDSIYTQWVKTNLYGYNLRLPGIISKEQAFELMQTHLTNFFSLYLSLDLNIETRPKKFLVLRTIGNKSIATKLLTSKGGKSIMNINDSEYQITNKSFGSKFFLLIKAASPVNELDILDSTGIDRQLKVDFILPKNTLNNLDLTQRALASYGLTLKEEELRVPVLIISKK